MENIATADVAFQADGGNLEELFVNAAKATMAVMADLKTIKSTVEFKFQISQEKLEDLLFDFLSELIFLKDKQSVLFSKFDIQIHYDTAQYHSKGYKLEATVWGEVIDPNRHRLRSDVKAVTWHLFKVEKKNQGYQAQVILDI